MIELILAEYIKCQFNASLVSLLCASWGYRRQEKETSVLLKGLGNGEREVTSDKGSRLCQFSVSMEILHLCLIQDFLHRSISPIVYLVRSPMSYLLSRWEVLASQTTFVLQVDGPRGFIERQRGARKCSLDFLFWKG